MKLLSLYKTILLSYSLAGFVFTSFSQTITRVEYFVDSDPGFGNAVNVPVVPSSNVSNLNITVNITSLNVGTHNIFVRTQDDQGRWSVTNHWLFFRDNVSGILNKVEYFIDTDPGFGNATNIAVAASSNITNLVIPVNIAALSAGFHNIFIRSRDDQGKWATTNHWLFFKDKAQGNLQKGEYFFDIDPGFGNGTAIPFGGSLGTNISDFSFAANTTSVPNGVHTMSLRTQDVNGTWSLTNIIPFQKITIAPITLINFSARRNGNEAILNWSTSSERNNQKFIIERSADGVAFLAIGEVISGGNSSNIQNYYFTDHHPLKTNYYRLRQVDIDQHFTITETRKVDMNGTEYFAISNNPAYHSPLLVSTTYIGYQLSLFDITGKKLNEILITNQKTNIPVDQLAAGNYLLVLHNHGKVVSVEKVLVRF